MWEMSNANCMLVLRDRTLRGKGDTGFLLNVNLMFISGHTQTLQAALHIFNEAFRRDKNVTLEKLKLRVQCRQRKNLTQN